MNKNLIYISLFYQSDYIKLLELLINSIYVKGNLNKDTTDILIMTLGEFKPLIEERLARFELPISFFIKEVKDFFPSLCVRFNIFDYENINNYRKILSLDADILINSDINVLFNDEIPEDKLYAIEEGTISGDWYGGKFFDDEMKQKDISAFSAGVQLFHNSEPIRELFRAINNHIHDHIHIKNNPYVDCFDQAVIVYNAISQNKYDNNYIKKYAQNNPSTIDETKIIYHFPGGVGYFANKYDKMLNFWNQMNK
jgi:lipopolysaccharide biosynthesis glycosyltransferase